MANAVLDDEDIVKAEKDRDTLSDVEAEFRNVCNTEGKQPSRAQLATTWKALVGKHFCLLLI
jgi:hypothetical protein